MIDTPAGLAEVVAAAQQAEAVALDTEFVWERTYYPRLGLIQLALPDGAVHLLDTVALNDLAPLGAVLADASVVKVLHDAVQDLVILRRATGELPVTVFDTRRAAGFVGMLSTISLQDLIEETVGKKLPKGETRTDWLRRPLSPKQLDYAEDDVRYLLDVRAELMRRADALGRTAWIEEEMERYDDPALYDDPDPREQLGRVRGRGLGKLSAQQRAVLLELAAWREREARDRDRPRRHVLEDEALIELARRQPERPGQLQGKGLGERQRRDYGDGIVEAIEQGQAVPPDQRPQHPPRHPDEDRLAAQTLVAQAFVAGRCARENVDPPLVATKSDLAALVLSGGDAEASTHEVLQGWRGTFIGDDLLALLRGTGALALDPEDGWPRFVTLG